MKFISLFSGIGGFDLGFERAGMTCVAQVEIDRAARRVLERHFPTVPRFEDVTHVGRHNLPAVDLVCGGFPCQDLSVAGRRAGLAGERSGLYFEFQRIVMELRPRYVVVENVPGLLSSNDGRDFAVVLGGLTGVVPAVPKDGWANAGIARGRADLYRVAWRVLDSQYFGVAQRRRRVFIVASLGDGSCASILFERESGTGDIETGGAAREGTAATTSRGVKGGSDTLTAWDSQTKRIHSAGGVAPTLAGSDGGGGQRFPYFALAGTLAASGAGTMRPAGQKNELDFLIPTSEIAKTLTTNYGKQPDSNDSSTPGNFVVVEAFTTSLPFLDQKTQLWCVIDRDGFKTVIDQSLAPTERHRTFRQRAIGEYADGDHALTIKARDGKDATDLIAYGLSGELNASKELIGSLDAGSSTGGGQPAMVGVLGGGDAQKIETNAREILYVLRRKAGAKAFTEWAIGILASLQQAKVLRHQVRGEGARCGTCQGKPKLVNRALSRTKARQRGFVRTLWIAKCERCASQRWGLDEQQSRQLRAYLSELSQQGALQQAALRDLWETAEGIGVLQQALYPFQEVWRSTQDESQPAYTRSGVRRLTPTEAERLQGFPDNWTATQADSPRYKQLGNAVTVSVIEWIGQRMMESLQ